MLSSFRVVLGLMGVALAAIPPAIFAAPLHQASEHGRPPIRDETGRIYFLIRLHPGAFDSTDATQPAAHVSQRFESHHSPQSINGFVEFERRHGFEHKTAISLVGTSISAYLTAEQLARVRADDMVASVTEVTGGNFSTGTPPPWPDDTASGGDTYPWGRTAIGGTTIAGLGPIAYVLDGGVGHHVDLGAAVVDRQSAVNEVSPVGCYPHATHVAGIIAAARNGTGVIGVATGARIVSISIATRNLPPQNVCGDNVPEFSDTDPDYVHEAYDEASFLAGLQKVRADMTARWLQGDKRTGILNLSLNAEFFASASIRQEIYAMTVPATNYAGVFVVQSAGNYYNSGSAWMDKTACQVAYGPGADNDGIMVVGGLDRQAEIPRAYPIINSGQTIKGSNLKDCVDVYAPSYLVSSTYGPPVAFSRTDPATWQIRFAYHPDELYGRALRYVYGSAPYRGRGSRTPAG